MKLFENFINESVKEIYSERGHIFTIMLFIGFIYGFGCFIGAILNLIIGGKKNG